MTVRLLGVPAAHEVHEVGAGLGVDGGQRLVEQDHAGVLQQQPGEQRALHLAARQRADGRVLEARQADGRERLLDGVAVPPADAAEHAAAPPQPHGDEVVDVDREGAVDLGGLRQIGHRGPPGRSNAMEPPSGFSAPAMPFSRVDLPAPFGPTTASRLPAERPLADDARPDGGS